MGVMFAFGYQYGSRDYVAKTQQTSWTPDYTHYAETDKKVVQNPYDRVLAEDETVPNVNDGGPSSFRRYDDRGVVCLYENTWAGPPDNQYIFLLYCPSDVQ